MDELYDVCDYNPDTFDLNKNVAAAEYWFPCFRSLIIKFAKQAADSQRDNDPCAGERADKFREVYIAQLDEYEHHRNENAKNNIPLSTRELLEMNDSFLRHFGFCDPWEYQKQQENMAAMRLLEDRLKEIDTLDADSDERWTELVRGVLAGNMFDWGASEVAKILENDKSFGLHAALDRIQKRPWLIDNLDAWLQRQRKGKPHKCAAVFVDNSGVDIILGILPFVRELLKRGTKVLLCANTDPSLNDVTANELHTLLSLNSHKCKILEDAWTKKQLLVYENGQFGPCLDMRRLPEDLNEALRANETDLLVIEGMGRAVHTNFFSKFNCETLKLAVIKNKWIAEYLGGDTFSVICKYETIS